jgi:cytochrome c
MKNFAFLFLAISSLIFLAACEHASKERPPRPMDPWAFRSVLDKQPRMLTLALDSFFFVAYDLSRSQLYKAWKGGVTLEGTVYTDKKNVQPTSWGKAYYVDSLRHSHWELHYQDERITLPVNNRGYRFENDRIILLYEAALPGGSTLILEESPEFVRDPAGRPGLERRFTVQGLHEGTALWLVMPDSSMVLKENGPIAIRAFFDEFPAQSPPSLQGDYDHLGRYWMENSDCFTCHEMGNNNVGPSFQNIADRYPNDNVTKQLLIQKVKLGSSGAWGASVMNPHPQLADNEIKTMLDYIFSLKKIEKEEGGQVIRSHQIKSETPKPKPNPGHGAALAGVHPSFDLQTIHADDFKPKVGGLAFLPDGRLLVTTWDLVGGVYLLDGVDTGDTTQITVKRIASGLAEPLGIEVVDGEIYVLQKHELTHLVDLDGDDIIDEYRVVCNSWGVTGDFHEFAFGLVYKEGHFYLTLSMAMRLMEGEKQHPDRGRTIKVAMDGTYEWLNYGLRTPNGIGLGPDDELFVTDNQGQWLAANKLIHVKKDEYLGMAWGILDPLADKPEETPPAIWLPDAEIGNSPTEPVLIQSGPYAGQLLHGDVTHGGIKRDFLEKVNGEYQGAVFRFSQGFEAGVNRLAWGPDGALYVGGVGMVGGWSWQNKRYGLQRMVFNGKSTFEMLAVRAKSKGFEIEFTEPLAEESDVNIADWLVQQWRYESTEKYGGPKLDMKTLSISQFELSEDRKRMLLEIPDLKESHVVYFRLPETLKGESGQDLWSSEAWYTLNHIPKIKYEKR